MKEKSSDVIEVRLSEDRLQVLRNQKVVPFTEQRWMDLHGETLHLILLKLYWTIFLQHGSMEFYTFPILKKYGNLKRLYGVTSILLNTFLGLVLSEVIWVNYYYSPKLFIYSPGAFVFVPGPDNVTVMLLSGVGVEVRAYDGLMAVTVLLPPEFTNHTQGLLGRMNSDPSDDLTTQQGEAVSTTATPEEIFTFGAGCEC